MGQKVETRERSQQSVMHGKCACMSVCMKGKGEGLQCALYIHKYIHTYICISTHIYEMKCDERLEQIPYSI